MRDKKAPELAFTLVEIIIVITILGIIIALGTPITLDFYYSYEFSSTKDNLVSLLRKSQTQAISNLNQASSGLYLEPGKFITFQGASYEERNILFDEEYEKPNKIIVSGISEIVFSPLSGRPSTNATITLSGYTRSADIYINKEGLIEW